MSLLLGPSHQPAKLVGGKSNCALPFPGSEKVFRKKNRKPDKPIFLTRPNTHMPAKNLNPKKGDHPVKTNYRRVDPNFTQKQTLFYTDVLDLRQTNMSSHPIRRAVYAMLTATKTPMYVIVSDYIPYLENLKYQIYQIISPRDLTDSELDALIKSWSTLGGPPRSGIGQCPFIIVDNPANDDERLFVIATNVTKAFYALFVDQRPDVVSYSASFLDFTKRIDKSTPRLRDYMHTVNDYLARRESRPLLNIYVNVGEYVHLMNSIEKPTAGDLKLRDKGFEFIANKIIQQFKTYLLSDPSNTKLLAAYSHLFTADEVVEARMPMLNMDIVRFNVEVASKRLDRLNTNTGLLSGMFTDLKAHMNFLDIKNTNITKMFVFLLIVFLFKMFY